MHIRLVAVVAALIAVGALITAVFGSSLLARSTIFDLTPGENVVVRCSTSLSGTISPNEWAANCEALPSTPTLTPMPVSFPIRAAFYYPWFPEAWSQQGFDPFTRFTPSLGFYDSSDLSTIVNHVVAMRDAKIDVAIASWWGQGTATDGRVQSLLDSGFQWALYYEAESQGNPRRRVIEDDLDYIEATYASDPSYLKIGGKPVIFVFAGPDDDCGMVQRWDRGNSERFHVVLKVFPGYLICDSQPDGWHQYAPAVAADHQAGFSYSISPGFWRPDETSPRLARDRGRFAQNVRDMVTSNEPWQLITSFNEWGEGTSIEEAEGWGTDYLDILAADGVINFPTPTPTPTPCAVCTPTPTPVPGASFSFSAAGDHGDGNAATDSLNSIANDSGIEFHLALGDMSYNANESAWCDYVKGIVGVSFPFQLIVGNHEDDVGDSDGFIDNFASCLPDRLGSAGNYAHRYYFDYPASNPTARIIMADIDLRRSGSTQEYCHNDTTNCNWLRTRIQEAKAQDLWVIVGMHKVCLSIGNKDCAINQEVVDVMVAEDVDLVLQAHDHDYQRSHSLSCAQAGTFLPACVADDGADGLYAIDAGTIFVINGAFGRGLTPINTNDSEFGYFAAWAGGDGTNTGVSRANGYTKYTVTADRIEATFVPTSGGNYTDTFVIE